MADEIRSCRDLEARLTPYVDGEEPPAGRQSIDAHLDACPPCRDHAVSEAAPRDVGPSPRAPPCAQAPASLRARCSTLAPSAATVGDVPVGADQSPVHSTIPIPR